MLLNTKFLKKDASTEKHEGFYRVISLWARYGKDHGDVHVTYFLALFKTLCKMMSMQSVSVWVDAYGEFAPRLNRALKQRTRSMLSMIVRVEAHGEFFLWLNIGLK